MCCALGAPGMHAGSSGLGRTTWSCRHAPQRIGMCQRDLPGGSAAIGLSRVAELTYAPTSARPIELVPDFARFRTPSHC